MKTPTMKDVAAAANVSQQTVSRIVNNVGYVKEETRCKVLDVIRKMQYYPNANARNLKGNSCYMVGLTIPDDIEATKNNMFYVQIIAQISSVCRKNGYGLDVISFDIYTDTVRQLIQLYRENVISGVIITSPAIHDVGLQELQESGLPFVFIGTPPMTEKIGYVDNCSEKLAGDAVDYLWGLGHRKIGLINGPMHMTMSRDFLDGYKLAMASHQLPFNQDIVRSVQLHTAEGELAMERIHTFSPDVTAVICADDALAIGALKASKKLGLHVPEDFSLFSLCYNDWNAYTSPALTGYRKNYDLLGNHAINMLFSSIRQESDSLKAVTVPHMLVEGNSCGPVRK